MNFINVFLLAMLILLSNCIKTPIDPKHCIIDEIKTFKENTLCTTGSKIETYQFQSKLVFLFKEGNCGADLTSTVLDSECNVLGLLGGISGNTKINNEEFSTALLITTNWEN